MLGLALVPARMDVGLRTLKDHQGFCARKLPMRILPGDVELEKDGLALFPDNDGCVCGAQPIGVRRDDGRQLDIAHGRHQHGAALFAELVWRIHRRNRLTRVR